MMEKLVATVKEHPYLIGGIALVVAIYFLWPSSSSSSSSSANATEAAAIAAASQANAQLQATAYQSQDTIALSHDQLSAVGIQAATAQAVDANDNATKAGIAALADNVAQAQIAAATTLGTTQYADALNLGSQEVNAQVAMNANTTNTVLKSQDSAQALIAKLITMGLPAPALNAFGLQASAVTAPPPPPPAPVVNLTYLTSLVSPTQNNKSAPNTPGTVGMFGGTIADAISAGFSGGYNFQTGQGFDSSNSSPATP
jgi:hypothetical protein